MWEDVGEGIKIGERGERGRKESGVGIEFSRVGEPKSVYLDIKSLRGESRNRSWLIYRDCGLC